MLFEVSPLLLAIAASIVGTTLQVWHRHGGASWMFAVGGFFFVLGRVMIAVICASVVVYLLSDGMGAKASTSACCLQLPFLLSVPGQRW
jgi:hypothetical protein